MMQMSMAAEMVDGTLVGKDRVFSGVSIDSRSLSRDDLFVAISGERFDGHAFVDRALAAGACGALVEQITNVAISQLKVADSTIALGKLAKHWRSGFSIPVIGITGSNGKTTVTAMVQRIIAQNHKPLFPEQSFNNQWGVPLTLLKLSDHSHAVIEMGMNHPGEIDYLAQIAAPTVAVINNAAAAHLEGLGDVAQVALAKGEILEALSMDGVAVLNADDEYFEFWRSQAGSRKVASFGIDAVADFYATDLAASVEQTEFVLNHGTESATVSLPIPGKHNVMNALAAAAATASVGISMNDIVAGLQSMAPVEGRLTPMTTSAGAALINDSFNANPSSASAAIDVLAQASGTRVLVLGAMAELGRQSRNLHQQTAEKALDAGIDRLLYLDDSDNADLQGYAEGFSGKAEGFNSVEALVAALQPDNHGDTVILVKGSKSSAMGRVVTALTEQEKLHEGDSC